MSAKNCLRNIVAYCPVCDRETDVLCREDDRIRCPWCEIEMEQHWWKRQARTAAQWSDADAVVVFRKPDGSFSYPAVNSKPTPEGCERIVMRSLREVEAHEKQAGVRSEIAWFDRGSGNGNDTQDLPSLPFRMRP
jgi:hypothetical protein